MIVKINALHKDVLRKTCAELGFKTEFFTMETNSNLLMVEILWETGRELTPESAFGLGTCFKGEVDIQLVG